MIFFNKDFKKWKEKAKERRLEIKALKKRNKELGKSRDNWKNKAENFKVELEEEKKKL